jgi:hypothetical protein
MKFLCPNCQSKSVKGFSKFKSSDLSPAVCSECGKFSTEPNWTKYVSDLYWCIGVWATALWALFSKSWLPLIVPLVAYLVYEIFTFLKMPLRPIAEATVQRRRWEVYAFIFLAFIAVMYATYTDYFN